MRGGFDNPEGLVDDEDQAYINSITWFGCPPNAGVDANSTISTEFFKVLEREADQMTGRVILPDDVLTWHPGNGGNIVPNHTKPLEIAFANWEPTQEALNEKEKKKAALEKAKAETEAAK